MSRYFSHWEYEDRRTFWGWKREWYPVYFEEVYVQNVVHIHNYHPAPTPETELARIARETRFIELETQRLLALKRKYDAEALMLDSQIVATHLKAQLVAVLPPAEPFAKAIPYNPSVGMKVIR